MPGALKSAALSRFLAYCQHGGGGNGKKAASKEAAKSGDKFHVMAPFQGRLEPIYNGKMIRKAVFYTSLNPSNMRSRQFLTMTDRRKMKSRVDPYSQVDF